MAAPLCNFLSIRRHPRILPRKARFSIDQAALYTVPVQLPGHFAGEHGKGGTAWPSRYPGP
ncbi:hypothetical protein DN387_02200 [Pseudomonas sp. FBF18]|nr:hypothetical protein [Pseudomonas sp. FBF18]MCQ0165650.1 hypothetical protein [Pseudomonas sp. S12(2018)]